MRYKNNLIKKFRQSVNKALSVAIGAGASFGAQTGIYVYTEANQNKGV